MGQCNTPAVSASGATTVWCNGPTGPTKLNRLDGLAGVTIGTLEMVSMRTGALLDSRHLA